MVTPQVSFRSKTLPGLVLHSKSEGVTVDLDPVRKVLEDSSNDFRRGMAGFLIMVLHTYLTRHACTSWPGQNFVRQTCFIMLVQQIFDPAGLYKLAGTEVC